jgi:hypothetical protein
MAGQYSINIPTKPYIKKYLEALYGSPVVFTQENYFGTSILAYLDRKFYTRETEHLTFRKWDKFSTNLTLFLPRWWLLQTHFGTDLPKQNIIYLNKHFENRFEEDLYKHCKREVKAGKQFKDAMEDFCTEHGISIEEDITFDSLKKKEQRAREKFQKNFIAVLSPLKNGAQNSFVFH